MKSFITKTGEIAYVPTDFEIKLIRTALKQLHNTLPRKGEAVDG